MLNLIKKILAGSPIKGEPVKNSTIHHTVMPVNVTLEDWSKGYYSKYLNNTE